MNAFCCLKSSSTANMTMEAGPNSAAQRRARNSQLDLSTHQNQIDFGTGLEFGLSITDVNMSRQTDFRTQNMTASNQSSDMCTYMNDSLQDFMVQ